MPTVVIADDSPTLRRIVTSVLAREGFEVIAVEDGVEAVQAVFRSQPDAVVLDVQMPRVSGYVAARLLKDDWQTSDIPIVLLDVTRRGQRSVLGRADRRRQLPHEGLRSTRARRSRDEGDRGGRSGPRWPAGVEARSA